MWKMSDRDLQETLENYWVNGGPKARELGHEYAAKTVFRLVQEVRRLKRIAGEDRRPHG
jgi:hypothetical protein